MLQSAFIHHSHGYRLPGGKCRVRIYSHDNEQPVVIATEVRDNDNTPITYVTEILAAQIATRHLRRLDGSIPPFVWIEHHLADNPTARIPSKEDHFWRVTFEPAEIHFASHFGRTIMRLGTPYWKRIEREEIARLIGESIPATAPMDLQYAVNPCQDWSV